MSILERAKQPEMGAIAATIVGSAGSGKNTLAASFPAPLFISTPGETTPRDIEETPDTLKIESVPELWEVLKAVINDKHEYQTIVFDSVTGLEQLFIADVIASDPKAKSINQAAGGYGAGRAAVAAMHGRVGKAAEIIRSKRNMNVLFLAHADISRIDPPDSEGYTQYTLRLGEKSLPPYVDNVDLVGFIKQVAILKGEEGSRKAVTTGDRVLVTYMTPASVAKNRFGITDDIDFIKGQNPLAPYLPNYVEEGV